MQRYLKVFRGVTEVSRGILNCVNMFRGFEWCLGCRDAYRYVQTRLEVSRDVYSIPEVSSTFGHLLAPLDISGIWKCPEAPKGVQKCTDIGHFNLLFSNSDHCCSAYNATLVFLSQFCSASHDWYGIKTFKLRPEIKPTVESTLSSIQRCYPFNSCFWTELVISSNSISIS